MARCRLRSKSLIAMIEKDDALEIEHDDDDEDDCGCGDDDDDDDDDDDADNDALLKNCVYDHSHEQVTLGLPGEAWCMNGTLTPGSVVTSVITA
eukprot:475419-Rhodomonas_salina.2